MSIFSFQQPVTPTMEGIISLHNYVMFYLIIIFFFVLTILLNIYKDFYIVFNFPQTEDDLLFFRRHLLDYRKMNHFTELEVVWTIVPGLVLLAIAFPSFTLLYTVDEPVNPVATLKITGYQWYWEYQWTVFDRTFSHFDSYMVDISDLKLGERRLLKTDNPLLFPLRENVRLLMTAEDVLHSWAVPSFGVKMDCVPGRLNQVNINVRRSGVFFGQCSELCGVNHAYMPIETFVTKMYLF